MTVNAVCPAFVDTPMVDESAERIPRATGRERGRGARRAGGNERQRPAGHIRTRSRPSILTLCLPQSRDRSTAPAITIDGGTTA